MATELAVGYVSILPSMRGFGQKLARELQAEMPSAGKSAGDAAQGGFVSGFAAKAGLVALGATVAATVGASFTKALDVGKANDKLAAQLGGSGEFAANLGKVSGELYANAYGESVAQVNDALRGVLQNGLLPEDATNDQIEAITAKVIDLATAFDQDVGAATAGVAQLIRTGLAPDADQALDILTRGFQQGADKAGDLLDTFTEYGTQFRKLGIDGPAATGLLVQGLQAGARDADKVADAIKEFSIRAVDGSELTAEGFEMVGLNAGQMAKAIAKGGPSANKALDETLDRLREVEDPVLRSQAAVALFGTQAEDLGDALFALDLETAAQGLGNIEGAAARMGDTLNNNAATKIEAFKRRALGGLTDFIGTTVIPGVESLLVLFEQEGLSGVLDKVGESFRAALPGIVSGLGEIATALGDWIVATAPEFGRELLRLGGELAAWVGPQIPPLLSELGHLMVDVGAWFLSDGVPAMVKNGVLLAGGLIGWVLTEALPGIVKALPDIVDAVDKWVTEDAVPALFSAGKELGAALVEGFIDSLGSIGLPTPGGFSPFEGIEFGIRRNHGGDVRAGQGYIVGDRFGVHSPSAELFVPDTNGTILPSVPDALGAAPISINVAGVVGESDLALGVRELRRMQLVGAR